MIARALRFAEEGKNFSGLKCKHTHTHTAFSSFKKWLWLLDLMDLGGGKKIGTRLKPINETGRDSGIN